MARVLQPRDEWFIKQGRKDPLTNGYFRIGQEVVVCAECGCVQLLDAWNMSGEQCACCGCTRKKRFSKRSVAYHRRRSYKKIRGFQAVSPTHWDNRGSVWNNLPWQIDIVTCVFCTICLLLLGHDLWVSLHLPADAWQFGTQLTGLFFPKLRPWFMASALIFAALTVGMFLLAAVTAAAKKDRAEVYKVLVPRFGLLTALMIYSAI